MRKKHLGPIRKGWEEQGKAAVNRVLLEIVYMMLKSGSRI
jgi:hypothetical protein